MKGAGDFSMGEKAMKSIEAGCDMVLVCNDYDGTMDVIDALKKMMSRCQRKLKI